jgi:hypothetical protein
MNQRDNRNGSLMHSMMVSGDELKILRQLLDLSVRQGGAAAAPAVTLFLQKVESAERTSLPPPAEHDSEAPNGSITRT